MSNKKATKLTWGCSATQTAWDIANVLVEYIADRYGNCDCNDGLIVELRPFEYTPSFRLKPRNSEWVVVEISAEGWLTFQRNRGMIRPYISDANIHSPNFFEQLHTELLYFGVNW